MLTDTIPARKRLSVALYHAVLLSDQYQYVLAKKIGMHPSILNKAIHGAAVEVADGRWKKLARLVNVPLDQIFEP
jgi:hypothetical protein